MNAGRAAVSRAGRSVAACDLVLVRTDPGVLVARRNFQPHWQWEGGYLESPLLSEELCKEKGMGAALAKALCAANACEYALLWGDWDEGVGFAAGLTRWADVTAQPGELPGAVVTLSADEVKRLAEVAAKRRAESDGDGPRLFPALDPDDVPESGEFRIALRYAGEVSSLWRLLGTSVERMEPARVTRSEALERYAVGTAAQD
jgi:hypothetical protein